MRLLDNLRLPDLITIINLLLGFTAILLAAQGNLPASALFILVAVLGDGLDGLLARGVEHSVFGEALDSLADLTAFGIGAGLVLWRLTEATPLAEVGMAVAGAYVVCGALRLARFHMGAQAPAFEGLPITAAGLTVALAVLARPRHDLPPTLLLVLVGLLCLLMVSSIPYPKLRDKRVLAPVGGLATLTVLLHWLQPLLGVPPAALQGLAGLLLVLMVVYGVSPAVLHVRRGRAPEAAPAGPRP
ncbi:MAG: CDP-diacylglycerol--serine O-phosphatidyltransferase [Euryarchaeota archaeon]|nr:CDP-diacylglycerol--serine O-phosphatidyltransferase [Euryarchaeota archaeon]